ncbi:hypothetical protein OH76DRAFT_1354246 [Lentinus brumalis]|uniref:Uncharacterized protein n=1 Tax=Lentinus brumalis TaxID=2498619 RepID=A0A371D4B1_9APHY|nr:hypothetical protein OH76DRAFT_1354246 [Polyporus brumalis]
MSLELNVLSISGKPCDVDGNVLPDDAPPSPPSVRATDDWSPFKDRVSFELAELLYQKEQMPAKNIDALLNLWAASLLPHREPAPFKNHVDLYDTIDDIPLGDVKWQSFKLSYGGEKPDADVPSWMTDMHTVHFRDPHAIVGQMLANLSFKDEIDWCPVREFSPDGKRRLKNFMGGDWAWRQGDQIMQLPDTEDSSFVPIILGSDKTTVSVATGQNDYYPLYLSIGNVHNNVRRAHRNAVAVIAFLAIPKTTRRYAGSAEFRKFRRQLFQSSLSRILLSLRPGMTKPEIVRCGDNHFRKVVYGIGPYIADYPEQALVASIVQGWCATCTALSKELDDSLSAVRRTRRVTDFMAQEFDLGPLWEDYGIVGDVVPFTNDFPRADIHELLSPDILHQLIKGTFKDHLVTWVELYLKRTHGDKKSAEIMAEIDRRIAVVPAFSKLRHFHEGRGFKQWTGDDSKALMKVYLPAIDGLLPSDIVLTIRYFTEFCYLARREIHDNNTTAMMQGCLVKFREYREIFRTSGVRPSGFNLPRQHSLEHYVDRIWDFAAPNGLCSSITESKHIKAVKEPWRRSNRYNALEQMLTANQRLDKIAAARVDFANRGMLEGNCLLTLRSVMSLTRMDYSYLDPESQAAKNAGRRKMDRVHPRALAPTGPDADPATGKDGDTVLAHMTLTVTPQRKHPSTADALGDEFGIPDLRDHIRRFLYHQLNPGSGVSGATLDIDDCPAFENEHVSIFYSAVATFYAPSDACGVDGMHREFVRATPKWRKNASRFDCVFVNKRNDLPGLLGMDVARVRLLLSFKYQGVVYPCAVVRWFFRTDDEPDKDTGMWVVEPAFYRMGRSRRRYPSLSVIHLNTIVRAAHLIGVSVGRPVPLKLQSHDSLDHFPTFFVNKFIDHHAFDLLHCPTPTE